eukprot:6898967-Ditylum_brightwellii.AAC.1
MASINKETNVSGKGFTISALHKLVNLACNDHEGDPPQTVDHYWALNPYKSLYGEQWEERIRHAVAMKKYVSICTLVWHMYIETRLVPRESVAIQ